MSPRWVRLRRWWGRLSLQARLAGAFALLAAGALIFLLAIIARTLGPDKLGSGKILPATVFVLAVFFIGAWLVARWCLDEISRLGARIREKPDAPLPAELEGLAALLRYEARQHDRLLHELRRFTADASHELRTPLTALRTVGESALRTEGLSAAVLRDAIGSMLEEVRRMNALIERLLRLARVESDDWVVERRSVLLAEQLQEWLDMLGVLAEVPLAELEVGLEVRAKDRWLRNAPVVDVAQGILNESLVFVVTPLPVHDEFVLVVPWGQSAHHRENLRTRRCGLWSHGYRLQPVGEGPAKVHLCVNSFRR